MEFDQLIQARHSVRDFKAQPVSESDLRTIISQAQMSPSWVNSQPWHVYVANGETATQIRTAYANGAADGIKGHPDLPLTHRTDWSATAQANMANFATERDAMGIGETFVNSETEVFKAPTLVFLTIAKPSNPWSLYDLGLFSQSLMLASKNLGIDSIPAYNIVRYPDVLREIMAIPADQVIVMGIALGYATDNPINTFQPQRQAVDDVMTIK